jgi:phosphatidylethanolamine-binding protein (PEBP) family uncharacterized protein
MSRSLRFILVTCVLVGAAQQAFAMSASFTWCSGSPEFQLRDVPRGTAKLDLRMTDLMAPSFQHGGGVVAYTGQAGIPCGAINGGYVGPSPPKGQVHTYRWTIQALDASGKVLGRTAAERKFPE